MHNPAVSLPTDFSKETITDRAEPAPTLAVTAKIVAITPQTIAEIMLQRKEEITGLYFYHSAPSQEISKAMEKLIPELAEKYAKEINQHLEIKPYLPGDVTLYHKTLHQHMVDTITAPIPSWSQENASHRRILNAIRYDINQALAAQI